MTTDYQIKGELQRLNSTKLLVTSYASFLRFVDIHTKMIPPQANFHIHSAVGILTIAS